jgi:hypothetical protein
MDRVCKFANWVLQITQGRTTAFFIAFFVAGNALQLAGKLTHEYVIYMGTLGALVLGHSVKEDLMAAKFGIQPTPPGGPDADAKT